MEKPLFYRYRFCYPGGRPGEWEYRHYHLGYDPEVKWQGDIPAIPRTFLDETAIQKSLEHYYEDVEVQVEQAGPPEEWLRNEIKRCRILAKHYSNLAELISASLQGGILK